MSPADLAQYLNISRESLYTMRASGKGPRWVRIGSRIRYRCEHVEAWIDEQREKELERQGSS
jgi:excisionase family DNA binding protein